MRYPASEKLEIIRTVETSHLPVRRALAKIGGAKVMEFLTSKNALKSPELSARVGTQVSNVEP